MAIKKDMIEVNFRLAAKAFIVRNDKIFIMKRINKDPQSPGIWEIPGGRLELGEDPVLGLMREVREETGLYVDVIYPMTIRHFKRDDGQIITMIVFLCKPKGGYEKISEEHADSKWTNLKDCDEELTDFFHKELNLYKKLNLKKLS